MTDLPIRWRRRLAVVIGAISIMLGSVAHAAGQRSVLNDEVAIQQTINRYSVAASKRDWDALIATFTPDAVWELTSGKTFQGQAAIREAMMSFAGATEYNVQMNAPAAIKVDGDRATATSIVREAGKPAGRDEAFEVLGFYEDELVRTADGWKFSHRTFVLKARHRYQLLGAAPK